MVGVVVVVVIIVVAYFRRILCFDAQYRLETDGEPVKVINYSYN